MSVFNRLIPLCQPLLVTKITFCETKLVFPVGDVNGDSIKHAMIIVNAAADDGRVERPVGFLGGLDVEAHVDGSSQEPDVAFLGQPGC